MKLLDPLQLSVAIGCSLEAADQWAGPLNEAMQAFGIWSVERQAGFLGQIAHETNGLSRLEENLYYSAGRLMAVWPNRFPTEPIAQFYAHNPEALGNYVYANRFGNGDEASGDGYRYRGRGPLMLTFKDNYREASVALLGNERLVEYPDHVLWDNLTGASVAARYWYTRGCNDLADQQDWEEVTRKINGGRIGLDDRIARIEKAMFALGDPSASIQVA